MKLFIVLLTTFTLLQTHGTLSFLYQKENRYSNILKKYASISQSISGMNLKITDESVDNLVNKLVGHVGDEEEVDKAFFEFEDKDDFDGFEDVDLDAGEVEDINEPSAFLDNVVISTSFGKWSCVYSRIFSVSSNKTKSFWKVHETAKQGGKISSTVQGSPDTKMTVSSNGKISGSVNITVSHEGKEYKSTIGINSNINSTEVDTKVGKVDQRYISITNAGIHSTIQIQNKTVPFGIIVSSKAETFTAPFRVYLTLFESDWKLDGGSGTKIGVTVRGEVTSRVVFSKNGKSLTKSWIKGYVIAEGDQICSVKMFKIGSHIWTKLAAKEESSESDQSDEENDTTIDVCTYTKGKVYERAQTADKTKMFAGSGVATYEKARVSIPGKIAQHEYGVHWMVKNLLDRKLVNWGKPSPDILDF